jgi:hypothetical protein
MNNDEKDSTTLRLTLAAASDRVSRFAHHYEHLFHLAYFGALSTGMLSHYLMASACLFIGILAMLPEKGATL